MYSFQGAASPSKASRDTRLDPGGQVNPEPVRVLSTASVVPTKRREPDAPRARLLAPRAPTTSSKVSGKAGWPRSIAPSTTPSARWLPSRKTASSHPKQYDSSTGRPGCWPPSAIRTCHRVTDHFSIEGQGQYLVMDFITGSLRARLEQMGGALPKEESAALGEGNPQRPELHASPPTPRHPPRHQAREHQDRLRRYGVPCRLRAGKRIRPDGRHQLWVPEPTRPGSRPPSSTGRGEPMSGPTSTRSVQLSTPC